MERVQGFVGITGEQDHRISQAVEREQARLRNFIRRRVSDEAEAEDVLQDVFYELVLAYRLMKPIENAGAWLFRVARNRIIDLFRRRRPDASLTESVPASDETFALQDLLPSPESGPEAAYVRSVLLEELEEALDELPEEQREVFIAHEIEGRSFKDLSAETGLKVGTLISRKHYAVKYLRERLQDIYQQFIEE
jgi:RNA polymerase sigma factor (sigma-70 family)